MGDPGMSEVSVRETIPVTGSGPLITPGARIGKYDIVHRIACGGMAEIYLARANGLYGFEKHIVLKRILPQYAANMEFVRMFLKEARVAATLDHANIAHVYDIDETGGSTFFTMEYLHGEDVRQVMRQLDEKREQLPLEHALQIVMGAASGLHFAHEKRGPDGSSLGIVHRDISPANIVVTYDGGVKVVDFGIAKLAADPELSQRYSLKGKLAYMSPEQLHNQPVDRRSDVFALGIVLYEITTKTRLFKRADEVQTMKAVLDGVIPAPSTLQPGYPAELERIVLRALALRPEERYQSARELQLDLEAFAREARLRVSSAGLAEWMERTFGPKQEIWRTLPRPAAASPAQASAEGTAPTRPVSRAEAQAVPSAAVLAMSIPVELSLPEPAPRSWRWLLAAVVLVVAAGAAWGLARRIGAEPRAAAPASPVLLIADQGQVALEGHPPSAPAPPPAAAAAPTPAAAPAPTAPRAKRAVEPAGGSRASSFSATFARREGEIRRCFLEHAGGPTPSTEVSLRFEVGRDGHVAALAVLPEAVAASPLGACLAAVGKSTVFAKQSAPLTFRIPLTVQRDSAGKARP
jgi:serine/threonine protein kinase